MRNLIIATALFLLAGNPTFAQDEVRSNISNDLCSCFERINPEIGDAQFERALRNCLENALLNNPQEIDRMVKLREGSTNKGFSIGQWLGSMLQNDCPSFKPVRERMSKMQLKLTQRYQPEALETSWILSSRPEKGELPLLSLKPI